MTTNDSLARRALGSPIPLAAAAAGGAIGAVVTGLDAGSVVPAIVFAVVGWAGGAAALAASGGVSQERLDPFTLGEPWRHFVRGALQAQARYDRTVSQTRPGPLHDRLVDIGRRIDVGVHECWEVAQRGDALQDAMRALDVPGVRRRLEALTDPPTADDTAAAMTGALQARLESAERLRTVSEEAEDRLRLLDARLGEIVARGVELSMHRGEDVEALGLGDDVDDLVDELTVLRAALDETEGGPTQAGPDTNTAGG